VHSDLKPENILISTDLKIEQPIFKIIDLGSSFPFSKALDYLEITTPEYLAPEILDYVDTK
jgi:serine/threonine protein kinase